MLPILTKETRESSYVSALHNGNSLRDALARMQVDNPELFLLIFENAMTDDLDLNYDILAKMTVVYELLRRQDESDEMAQRFA